MQSAMAQAMHGMALPPNCFVLSLPFDGGIPQMLMNSIPGGTSPMVYSPYPTYYDRFYPYSFSPYQDLSANRAVIPYTNQFSPVFQSPQFNYPMLDYNQHKNQKTPGKVGHNGMHSNVYNSSSFDSHMENLSWSRLFGHQRKVHPSKAIGHRQAAIDYQNKGNGAKKQPGQTGSRSSSMSSTTTSDETIRRVNLATKQASNPATLKNQTKGSLPFKYSSDFVPGSAKKSPKKTSPKDPNLRSDDEFVVQKVSPKAHR